MGAVLVVGGALLVHILGGLTAVVDLGFDWVVMGPGSILVGAVTMLRMVWHQLRGIKLTPEGIIYWRGIGKITLTWDQLGDAVSTNDVRDHEGYRRHLNNYLPGAKVAVPVERVLGVMLRVH